ncbi:MAG TPA: SGNH/GDSL hydrolase family protein, partial [Vicinamibacterales bacterium]
MRIPFGPSLALRALPPARALVLTAIAVLLAAADWLPANSYVDPDHLEFGLSLILGLSAIGICVRERVQPDTVRRWQFRILLSFITLFVSLAAAEPVTRWIFRDVTTSSDNGGYFSRRWYRIGAVETNQWGFRERNFSEAKSPGTYRVAVLGDSFTFGNGVRRQDRFSDVLQSHLPSHFEVLNFGVAGANTPEHLNLVQHVVPQFTPDFVLLQWYVNDVEDDDSAGRPRSMPLVPFRPLHNWLNDSSALYTVANMQWAETQVL